MDDKIYIYSDECIRSKGRYFSNFYGGALILGENHSSVIDYLHNSLEKLEIRTEVKWNKVCDYTFTPYLKFLDSIFYLIQQNQLKVRIMFLHNRFTCKNLTKEQKSNEYLLLYYQFLKHSFGLEYFKPQKTRMVNFVIDKIPEPEHKKDKFLEFINYFNHSFNSSEHNLYELEGITEKNSKEDIILQSVDLILGGIQAKLNDTFKNSSKEKYTRRPKRTVLREKTYTHLNKLIQKIYPNFNIGISTGIQGNIANRFTHSYRHWCFKPTDCKFNKAYQPKD